MGWNDRVEISALIGKTFTTIRGMESGSSDVWFDGDESFKMFHSQDCCESVYLDDVCGSSDDLIGTPIVEAYEADSGNAAAKDYGGYSDESYTWTFYRLATIKGTVTLKWYGSSNGYYSEGVDIERVV